MSTDTPLFLYLQELMLKVSQKNPLPLPERDQVTVNIEMMVSRDKINFLFGLSR